MGQIYSNLPSVNLNSYEEIVEEPMSTNMEDQGKTLLQTPLEGTAGKMSKNLTALIDPRSPTVGVSRTPVEVTLFLLTSLITTTRAMIVIHSFLCYVYLILFIPDLT